MEEQQDPGAMALAALVRSSQRQEELFGKVCELLESLNDKMDHFNATTARLEQTVANLNAKAATGADASGSHRPTPTRGALVQPPGRTLADPRRSQISAPVAAGGSAVRNVAEEQAKQEALEREQRRLTEEEKSRQEELRQRRVEEEHRRKQEEDARRLEELRVQEEERKRKEALEQKTRGLMSNLITGGGPDLFPDEPKRSGGGLFDDL
eukprot:GEMP01048670.1.p1 GENE.GEMP01048670.1~~GEMP01048670.1.p1  ORF type:complete len:219 (+),score=57.49 GEMP01048670.1:30-659(+)